MASRTSTRKIPKGEYIETDTGNKISRRSKIEGTPHIILGGRVVIQADACLRGDLCRLASPSTTTTSTSAKEPPRTAISIGRYTLISTGATIHPPHRIVLGGDVLYYPMKIGDNVFIGPGSYVNAASIGSNVHVGAGSVIGNGCIVKDCVKVLEGAVMAAGMVAPSGVVVGGRPARILGDLPEGWGVAKGDGDGDGDGEWVEGGDLREMIRAIK